MRTKYALITLLSALPILAFAQSPPAPALTPPAPAQIPSGSTNTPASPGDARLQQTLPKPVDSDVEFQALRYPLQPTTGQVSRVVVEGALARATKAGQPWQVLNPAAPMEFGDALDNVSLDPRTGQANGIVLFSIRFGGHRK